MTRTDTELRLTERLSLLADFAATVPTARVDDHSLAELMLPPRHHRSRIPATIAAGFVILAAVGSVVVVAQETGDGGRPGVTAAEPSANASFDQGPTPPDVELAGWTRASAQSSLAPPAAVGNRLFFVLVDDARAFDGPRIKVGVTAPPLSFSPGPLSKPIDVNGTEAAFGTAPDKAFVVWSPAPSRIVYVEGTRAGQDRVLEVARGLRLAPDLSSATATVVPDGLRVVPVAEVSTDPVQNAEFRFERDGARFQVNLYAGGETTLEQRLDDPARTVTVRGTQAALITDDGKHFRLKFPNGRWAVEIAGGPFPDEQAFLAVVDQLVVTPAG